MPDCAFNYSGSKSDYAELHVIDEPVVDLFGGGGGFWSHIKSPSVTVNDVNVELVAFQKIVHDIDDERFETLVRKLYDLTENVNTREAYEELRARFNNAKNPVLFYAVLACCTNNMIRYNKTGGFNQTWGQRKFNPSMERKLRAFRERIRSKQVEFMSGDYSFVPTYDSKPLYFADPPYYITSTGYNTAWGSVDENCLYSYLTGKRFLMTNFLTRGELTNHILVSAIDEKGWVYRILREGKMRAQRDKDKTYTEIIVADSENTLSLIGS